MIFTARQLEDMHRAQGQIVLPYQARLTPLAKDWCKAKQIAVGYSAVDLPKKNEPAQAKSAPLPMLWWCDGPAGSARAAMTSAAKELSLEQMNPGPDPKQLPAVIKLLVSQVKSNKVAGGVLLVKNAAAPLLYANRNAVLRAVSASTLISLGEAMNAVSPNVLVIEHTRLTVQQIKNMILRFGRSNPGPGESLQSDLKEMTQCG
jgi:hypothetical protein